MNDGNHVIEELSALLDGEAEDARYIEAHLKACPECTQRYRELKMVAVEVRRMRAPEVRPEFVTQVLARIRDERPVETRAPWWAFLTQITSMQLMYTAGAVAVASALFFAYFRPEPPRASPAETQRIASRPVQTPESVDVISDLARRGVDVAQLADALGLDESTDAAADPISENDTGQVIDTAFTSMLNAGWSGNGDDVFATIDDMTSDEQAELQMQLQNGAADSPLSEG